MMALVAVDSSRLFSLQGTARHIHHRVAHPPQYVIGSGPLLLDPYETCHLQCSFGILPITVESPAEHDSIGRFFHTGFSDVISIK